MSDLRYLVRVKTEIPVIKLGCEYVARLIVGLKESNAVVEWGLNKASSSVDQVVKYPMQYIENYLPAIDQILCTSLDLTELNLPVLTKTPQQVYEESREYFMGIVTPIKDWVDFELLPPAEYCVDRFLPELDPNQKISVFNDKVDSKASKLTIKLLRRVKQHAYAEPKYLGALVGNGYEKLILLIKIFINNPNQLSIQFRQIRKKLSDGVTPEETANSLLLVEMGCIQLRKFASLIFQMIDFIEQLVKCYIEMFVKYVNEKKDHVIDHFSCEVINSTTKLEEHSVTG